MSLTIRDDVPLAPLTTLELGGRARHLVEASTEEAVSEALRWAKARGVPVFILGGGSNVVVADRGWGGLVVRVTARGRAFATAGDETRVMAAAGEPWDDLVADTVARGLAGLECLSGIPGLVGATPVQNVG
ncbi:MAG TPA: FAD-binding protein, partial [Polyangia bacterium]|nr:FAD-binding protein [Polyangia bacterium]